MSKNTLIGLFIAFGLLSVILFVFMIFKSNKNTKSEFANEFYYRPLKSKIIEKWIDKSNHNAHVISWEDIETKERKKIHCNTSGLSFDKLWDVAVIGDILFKDERTLLVTVVKGDSTSIDLFVYDVHHYINDTLLNHN
ncbi:MAG: hypothetical protein FGM41_02930 [Bacteroidetes bacterium]|nr:hypothetical protein [Bacteroidota bacterium]